MKPSIDPFDFQLNTILAMLRFIKILKKTSIFYHEQILII